MKYRTILLACLFILGFSVHIKAQIEPSAKEMESYYRWYVLAECIYIGFDKDKVFEKDITFSILNDITEYVKLTSHGRKLDSLVKIKIQSIPPSQIEDYQKKKAIILESMRYYDSEELKRQVQEILKSPRVPIKFK
ncbi:MAG: hypothetical protein EOO43_13790 [Flavobacterium sp.]|nr:MAG: hypothetical protein EOO43_13790 [Flavobacterium sp.]